MAIALLALVLSSGCGTWQLQRVRADHLVASERPREVRLQLRDGSRIVVYRPEVSGESLVGWPYAWQEREKRSPAESGRISIPLDRIASCEVRREAGGGAVLVVTGVVAIGVALLAISATAE